MMKKSVLAIILLIKGIPLFALEADLLSYDLEDLSQIAVIENTATLTSSDPKEIPASVVTITSEDIIDSGARNLDELLEIYVPGFAYMYKVEGNQMGIRGIVSDRNNKIMLLVNGKRMNLMTSDGGAVTERWFPLLGDIRRVTVINGPGSAVYGAGAIAGVISIETFDGSEKEGFDLTLQGGIGEEFEAFQIQYGHTFENGNRFFGYYGIDSYRGADEKSAPHKLAFDLVNRPWDHHDSIQIHANERFPFMTTNDNATFEKKYRQKLHLQFKGERFELWTRYTQSGLSIPTLQGYYRALEPWKLQNTGTMNRQWSTVGKYLYPFNAMWDIEGMASYMVSDMFIDIAQDKRVNKNWREKELSGRVQANYVSEDEEERAALGIEYTYSYFGDVSSIGQEKESHIGLGIPNGTKWHTAMLSFFGEYQKHLWNQWTLFAGLRADKHTYSQWMLSPRISMVYIPDASTVFKLVYNRSVRHSDDAELYKMHMLDERNGDVETIDNIELIFDYYPEKAWHFGVNCYYNHHNVVAFNDADKETGRIGTVDFYGIEGTLSYHTEKMDLFLSHNYTKQLDFTLRDPETLRQNISASVKGYGNDFANWYNHISKLNIVYRINERFSWSSSVRLFWNMPGAVDMAEYNMKNFLDEKKNILLRLPLYKDSKEVFETAIYWNAAIHYRYSDEMDISLYGYNLAGLFDQQYNKRNYFQRTSHYREAAPALSVRMNYRF